MVSRRSRESSSPIKKSRNTTPSSPSEEIASGSVMTKALRNGKLPVSEPRTSGLRRKPTSRKPNMELMPRRTNRGTINPAAPRMIRNSL
jgi:hypothetical protein